MFDRDRAGQHILIDFEGPEITPQLEHLIRDGRVGGVVLFERNIRGPDQVRQLTGDLQALADAAGLPPLLITVDQEGGLVNRLMAGFTVFPSAMAIGAAGREEDAAAAARITARELRAVGINTNHAPVVDVNTVPDNPIIGARAFGEDPEVVARLGAAYVRAARAEGVLATVKHFPGHGPTAVDSHLDLPVISKDRTALWGEDLVPFAAAFRAGTEGVIAAHLLVPSLDSRYPATLSVDLIDGLLRGDLGFDGVVGTDSMAMRAIADRWGRGEAAVAALGAGIDLVMACGTEGEQWASIDAVRQAAADGVLAAGTLQRSAQRVARAKAAYARSASGGEVGAPPHRRIAQEIADRAVTLVRGSRGRIPLASGRTVVVNLTPRWRDADETFAQFLHDQGAAVTRVDSVDRVPDDPRAVMVALTLAWGRRPPATHVRTLAARFGDRLIVVGLGNPYELTAFPEVSTYLVTYGPDPASLLAAAKVLTGTLVPVGRLPVTIPGLYPRGHRAE